MFSCWVKCECGVTSSGYPNIKCDACGKVFPLLSTAHPFKGYGRIKQMNKFKVGDRVRVLRDEPNGAGCLRDDIGTIKRDTGNDYVVSFDVVRGCQLWYVQECDLKLACGCGAKGGCGSAQTPKTHTVTIPEDREVTGVETKEDHIRVNLKKKIEVGRWYRGSMTGRWGQLVGPSLRSKDVWALCSLNGESFDVAEDLLEEIEPFEEILQVLDITEAKADGDLVWDASSDRWIAVTLKGRLRPHLRECTYARKRKVLKPEFSGGQ